MYSNILKNTSLQILQYPISIKPNYGYYPVVFKNEPQLLQVRKKLEGNDYKSSKGKLMNNHDLYKLFFEKLDNLNLSFIKVKGHKKNSLKDEIDEIFNLVDKASRNALREDLANLK